MQYVMQIHDKLDDNAKAAQLGPFATTADSVGRISFGSVKVRAKSIRKVMEQLKSR